MLDPSQLIHVSDVPRHLPASPRTGRRYTTKTVYQWINVGCRGVRLRCRKIGRSTWVHKNDLDDFIEKLTAMPLEQRRAVTT